MKNREVSIEEASEIAKGLKFSNVPEVSALAKGFQLLEKERYEFKTRLDSLATAHFDLVLLAEGNKGEEE